MPVPAGEAGHQAAVAGGGGGALNQVDERGARALKVQKAVRHGAAMPGLQEPAQRLGGPQRALGDEGALAQLAGQHGGGAASGGLVGRGGPRGSDPRRTAHGLP